MSEKPYFRPQAGIAQIKRVLVARPTIQSTTLEPRMSFQSMGVQKTPEKRKSKATRPSKQLCHRSFFAHSAPLAALTLVAKTAPRDLGALSLQPRFACKNGFMQRMANATGHSAAFLRGAVEQAQLSIEGWATGFGTARCSRFYCWAAALVYFCRAA